MKTLMAYIIVVMAMVAGWLQVNPRPSWEPSGHVQEGGR